MDPSRTGLSPMPSDLALTLGEDANVHVGINHPRAGTFRAVWHANDKFAWGLGIENAQQFVGNEVLFPAAFNSATNAQQFVGGQFDNNTGGGTSGIPNVAPDLNTKLPWYSDLTSPHYHAPPGRILPTLT